MDQSQTLRSPAKGRQRSAAFASSILGKLPPELLLHVTNYLPPVSAAAFSLSCMHLRDLLGNRHISEVKRSIGGTIPLLNLLALDLPNHIVCSSCRRLHSMKNIRRYNSCTRYQFRYRHGHRSPPACLTQDRADHTEAVTELFGATAFKMAVKRYHHQPESTTLLAIMSSKSPTIAPLGNYFRLHQEECRVVEGCLMHRLQSVYVSGNDLNAKSFGLDLPDETICPHVKVGLAIRDIGTGVKRCQACRTDYRIDSKHYDGHGLAMFFTRWKNLGPGPESELWTQHLQRGYVAVLQTIRVRKAKILLDQPHSRQPSVELLKTYQGVVRPQDEDISSAFGDSVEDFKLDSLLTRRNKANLFRYQKQCISEYKSARKY